MESEIAVNEKNPTPDDWAVKIMKKPEPGIIIKDDSEISENHFSELNELISPNKMIWRTIGRNELKHMIINS